MKTAERGYPTLRRSAEGAVIWACGNTIRAADRLMMVSDDATGSLVYDVPCCSV
jgi:hypothetical protein